MFRQIINRWKSIRARYAIVFTTFTVVLTILSAIATLEKFGALKPQTAGWLDSWATHFSSSMRDGTSYRVATLSWDAIVDGCDVVSATNGAESGVTWCRGPLTLKADGIGAILVLPVKLAVRAATAVFTACSIIYANGGVVGLVFQVLVLLLSLVLAGGVFLYLDERRRRPTFPAQQRRKRVVDILAASYVPIAYVVLTLCIAFVVGWVGALLLATIASLTYGFIVIVSAVAAALAGTGILVFAKMLHLVETVYKRGHGVEEKIERRGREKH
jgi:uncharacterized membrane protein (DUF485 family)